MRKPYLAGNWKLNLDLAGALDLVGKLRDQVGSSDAVDVAVAPSFIYLPAIIEALKGSPIRVGSQNVADQTSGAYTGEVSADMLKDIGCDFAIVGHSERRALYGETDAMVNTKVKLTLDAGLDVILCVGETLEEREAGNTEKVVHRHLTEGLAGIDAKLSGRVTIAYEPVWAIGTGKVATPEQAGEVHTYLRGVLEGLWGDTAAETIRIQYGGSVKPGNVAELMAVDGVDGALVGGAALDADSFGAIVNLGR
ncbi:MAG: triosephosphate isomerase [Planctomycetota bacterium]|jgi:triosephosphate isomerase